MMNSKYLQPAS